MGDGAAKAAARFVLNPAKSNFKAFMSYYTDYLDYCTIWEYAISPYTYIYAIYIYAIYIYIYHI